MIKPAKNPYSAKNPAFLSLLRERVVFLFILCVYIHLHKAGGGREAPAGNVGVYSAEIVHNPPRVAAGRGGRRDQCRPHNFWSSFF